MFHIQLVGRLRQKDSGRDDEKGHFTCACCHETFESLRFAGEAESEYRQNFPEEAAAKIPVERLCTECYDEFLEWMKTMTPAQIEAMRQAAGVPTAH